MLNQLPNLLTLSRILLAGVLIHTKFPVSIVIMAGITDFLDGFLARRLNLTSGLGSLLDPLADKLFGFALMYRLALMHLISWKLFILLLLKDGLLLLGFFLFPKTSVEPLFISKLATALQFLGALLVLYGYGAWILLISLVLGYVSLALYCLWF